MYSIAYLYSGYTGHNAHLTQVTVILTRNIQGGVHHVMHTLFFICFHSMYLKKTNELWLKS